MLIIDDLLLWLPAKGIGYILKKVWGEIEKELDEGTQIRKQLQQLQSAYETGEVAEEEFQQREAELIEQLALIIEKEMAENEDEDEDEDKEEDEEEDAD